MALPIDPNDEYDKLCRYTGHLFLNFGRLEQAMSLALRKLLWSRMTPSRPDGDYSPLLPLVLTSAVLGSMRYTASRDMIKRALVAELASADMRRYADKFFEHLGLIADLRDTIAHQQIEPNSTPYDGLWLVSNAITIRDLRKTQKRIFRVEAVAAASMDLVLAAQKFAGWFGAWVVRPPYPMPYDLSPPPWQYKQAMLSPLPRKNATSPQ